MYDVNDTICAISSAPATAGRACKSIIRVSGSDTYSVVGKALGLSANIRVGGLSKVRIEIEEGFGIDATIYSFVSPASYTGDDLVEIHVFAAAEIVQNILNKLISHSRLAGAGEFTLRAYLNGKIDLSQAEAVAEIIASSNKVQLEAAEKLLAGRLCRTIANVRSEIIDIMSLLEAGMDFAEEDIEFVSQQQAGDTIEGISQKLEQILNSSIHYEEMIDLPSVAFAGAPNAGKSSLLNVLLGDERSIISDETGTTRDVLGGMLELENTTAMLFDCAGLVSENDRESILDELAQQAAIEAIRTASLVVFCVDADKDCYAGDVGLLNDLGNDKVILTATKCDLVSEDLIGEKLTELVSQLGVKYFATSTVTLNGIAKLKGMIEKELLEQRVGSAEVDERIAINERHRGLVTKAIGSLANAGEEIKTNNQELSAMFLRAAYEELAGLEKEEIDEAILDRIFSRFCIGK